MDLDPLQIYTVMIYWRLETFVQLFYLTSFDLPLVKWSKS